MEPLSPTKQRLLEKLLRGEAIRQSREDPIEPRDPRAPAPLAPSQSQIWIHSQLNPGRGLYNEPMTLHFRGRLDRGALNRAFQALIERHEIWRTTFAYVAEKVVQAIHASLPIEIPFHDLTALAPETRAGVATRIATPDATRPMDLGLGPLLRARLFKLDEESYRLYLVIHHLVHDGASIYRVLISELPQIYDAFASGRPSPLPPVPLQYADFAVWQTRLLANDGASRQFEYWRRQLSGDLAPLALPADHPRPAAFSYCAEAADFLLPAEIAARIRERAQAEGVSPVMLLLAAYKAVLFRYSGQTDLAVGTVVDVRSRREFLRVPGFMMNTVALRSHPRPGRTFRDFLGEVRDLVLGAIANGDVPFDRLVRDLHIPRDPGRNPIFQAMFNYEPAEPNPHPQWSITQGEVSAAACKVDLDFQFDEQPRGYAVRITYCSDLFDRSTIDRLYRNWRCLLQSALDHPETALGDLALVDSAEIEELSVARNATARPTPETTIHQLFEAQAERAPDRIAVECGADSISYGELNRRANRLAHRLRREDAAPGALIALALDRSIDMVAALLAILKTGSAYVPIDPALPPERRDFILRDSQASLILTERSLAPDYAGRGVATVFVDELANASADPAPLATPEDLAYVLYTSGSTGNPKGVEIPHRAVVNFLESMRREPGFTADDSILAVTTLSFDIAGLELYLPLICGAKIVLARREEARDANLLRQLISTHKPSVMQATPAAWRALIDAGWNGTPGLKILCGGEALTRDLADQLLERSAGLWNMYGPTETTIWSTLARIQPGAGPVPIGRPIDNTQVFVLDDRRRLVPSGVVGELYIGGAGLARGYFRRPGLTRERFVDWNGRRLYRTGDLARWRSDGALECLGRTDHQVKIRGFRVELEEIEAALLAHPQLRATAVKAWPDASGNLSLAGYFVAEGSPDLRAWLRNRLPDYMIPSRFLRLEALPLTPNGKLDRASLPPPGSLAETSAFVAPASQAERKLAAIWASVLGLAQVGTHDNFFELGGYSLLIPKLLSRVEDAFGARLSMSCLLEAPTVAAFAQRLPRDSRTPSAVRFTGSQRAIHWLYAGPEMGAIAQCLGPAYPLTSPHLSAADEARLPSEFTLQQLAACLATDIRAHQPHGPYTIGGWCDAGILGYQVASELQRQGCEVDLLVLLDAVNPVVYLAHPFRARFSKLMFHMHEATHLRGREFQAYLRDRAGWMRSRFRPASKPASPDFSARFLRALLRYVPPAYDGRVLAISPRRGPRFREPRLHWSRLAAQLENLVVPGTHISMFHLDGGARHIAARIAEAIAEVQPARRAS